MVGSGSEYLYNLIVQLLGRELVYGVEDPGYPKPARIYAPQRGPLHLPPGGRTGDLPPDPRRLPRLRWSTSPPPISFPPGPSPRRGGVRPCSAGPPRAGTAISSKDDYDSEFRFTGLPIPALQSIDQADRVIYLNTFSRALAPPLRISYLVLPPPCWTAITSAWGSTPPPSPPWSSTPWPPFLSEGRFEQHLSRARNRYRALRDQVLEALEASGLAGRAQISGADAGLHFLVRLETERGDQELTQLARARGIRLSLPVRVLRLPRPGAPALSGHQLPGHPDGAPAPDPEGAGCAAPLSPGRKNSLGGASKKISLRPISINDKSAGAGAPALLQRPFSRLICYSFCYAAFPVKEKAV